MTTVDLPSADMLCVRPGCGQTVAPVAAKRRGWFVLIDRRGDPRGWCPGHAAGALGRVS